jgi:hypothetical protein
MSLNAAEKRRKSSAQWPWLAASVWRLAMEKLAHAAYLKIHGWRGENII